LRIEVLDGLHIVDLCMLDVYGREIKKFDAIDTEVDVSSLPSGVYFLRYKTTTQEYSQKFVISR